MNFKMNSVMETSKDLEGEAWMLAKQGIYLVINNRWKEAESLFLRYPDNLTMYSGYSFLLFMDALMSFEEDKLATATAALKDLEKRCTGSGWFKVVKSRVFGSSSEQAQPLAETLETQIILADSQVCLAILIFLQQDLASYLKGSWALRKAWKVYQSTYNEILGLYRNEIGDLNIPDFTLSNTPSDEMFGKYNNNYEREILANEEDLSENIKHNRRKSETKPMNKKTIIRLMQAVSFGYGLFQLGVSLLPPALLRVSSFLGICGNRQIGIACLMYARLGVDMRSPLATLSLLWYHTIVRPFYAIDGTNVQAGVFSASQLIEESNDEFGDSALFLFFRGRLCRLNSDIPEAVKAFEKCITNSTQREMKMLATHEMGWCHLIELDYENGHSTFSHLFLWSRWSRSFYSYVTIICKGAGNTTIDYSKVAGLCTLIKELYKGNQIDGFLVRRSTCFPPEEKFLMLDSKFWRLLVYEMLYLWNAMPSCSPESIAAIIEDCEMEMTTPYEEPLLGLAKLIQGCGYCIQGNQTQAIRSFKFGIEARRAGVVLDTATEDYQVLAYTQFELGAILFNSPETKEEGRTLLHQTAQLKNYDFEQRLNVRINSLLRQG